ncbi:2'-5' RNA ligase family protein [Streptomyces guryensis]|uniref:2'-5' RNA ligase family protein n=1 Tax=Streptomyces guryensis TaxID=2886947 RepID=A0A9Q3VXU2_9ACTN|nr:2'-5' RNA ligase family protein [Streptomyces guryensis]MCD9879473.1 2'-5' RNA ligase family protein [Streptomyces guryensis]
MADEESGRFKAGQTALVVPVPEAEPLVRPWRDRFDPAARAGVPAHVTVLFPFLPASVVDAGTFADLDEIFGRHRSFEVRFEESGRFPGVCFLAPTPDAPFRRLTEAVVDRWPQAPPYGGKYDPHPHLTVAQGQDDVTLDEIEAGLRPALPFTARVPTVDLVAHDGTHWRHRGSFALR